MDFALKHSSATIVQSLRQRVWRLASGPHVISLIDQAIVSGASFVSTIFVARWTVPSQLGIYSIGISLLVASLTIQEALISLPYTIQRHRPVGTPAESAGGSLMQSGLLAAVIVVVLAAAGAGLSAGGADPDLAKMVVALAAIVPFALLREFFRRFAFAHLRVAQAALLDAAVASVQLGLLYWFGRNGWMSSATACLVLGVACLPAVAIWIYLSRHEIALLPAKLRAAIRKSWTLGKWLFGSQVALLVQGYAAVWLLAWIAGAATTGVYAACLSVVSIANPLILGVGNVLTPRAVLAFRDGGGGRLWRQSVQDAVLLGLAMLVFCAAIAVAGESVLLTLYHGAAFEGRKQVLVVLAAALLANSLGMPATNALASMECTREIFCTVSGAAILTTFLVWHLTSVWGMVGAAYGVLLGSTVAGAARWTALSMVLRQRGPQVREAKAAHRSSSLEQATQVLREYTQAGTEGNWSVLKLDQGEQADVFVAESRCSGIRSREPVVIKLYKSSAASRLELAYRQFQCLSRSHALLGGRTCNGWRISAPAPLYLCRSPLALVMTKVAGMSMSRHFRTSDDLTTEILATAPPAIVAAMTNCWSAGRSHGDLNVDNIVLDPVAREISFVDVDSPLIIPAGSSASRWHAASYDLSHMLFTAAMEVKRDLLRPGVRARKLMFAERILQAFVGTIAEGEERRRLLDEIHACARLYLEAIDVSWSPPGYWRRLLRRNTARRIESTLERLKQHSISPKSYSATGT